MKRLFFFIPAMMAGIILFAQSDCSKNHPIYKVDNNGKVETVHTLGSDPEFTFLRNLNSPQQVLAALKRAENNKKYSRQVREMNNMLKECGFDNGVKDVTLSSISQMTIPKGTEGNMGNGHLRYSYVRLSGSKPVKAWKVTSDNGCYVAFLAPCGNAFYPGTEAKNATSYSGNKPACKDVAVDITSEPKEITIANGGEKHITKKTYIYYVDHCGCFTGCGDDSYSSEDGSRSRPLLVKTEDVVEPAAVTYKVSTNGTGKATVCNGTPVGVHADMTDVTVEKESEYTGNKPEVRKEYIEVSRREYRHALRCGEVEYHRGGCGSCR
jgi:hypothetical protein